MSGSRVLVTGGGGFIGAYVLGALRARGITPVSFDHRQPSGPPPFGAEQFLGDVRDATAVDEAVGRCDGVIHLAGVLGTSETIDNPRPSVETNILGGVNVFEAVRRYRRRAAYITVGNYWFLNTYSVTKTAAESLAWMYNREHGTEIAVVRALNAYGPGQKAAPVRKIIPNFILPALRGDPVTVYGDGEQVMDMIHAADVADVLVRALLEGHGQYRPDPVRHGDNPAKFEAGTGRRTTVNEIAAIVVKAVGRGSVQHVPMRGGEPERSVVVGDPETLRPLYGGSLPVLRRLEDGIEEAVEWYRRHA